MVNALKGKTLTTMTVILSNEEVAAELMDVANGHFEFMQEELSGWPSETHSILYFLWPRAERKCLIS